MDRFRMIYRKEFAELLGVKVETIRAWEKQGKITARRTPGGRPFYLLEDAVKITGSNIEGWEYDDV